MIQTKRLTLCRARPRDAEDMHKVFSDPRAMRYWSCLPFTDLAQTQAFLAEMAAADPAQSDDFIVHKDGCAIGKAGCWGQGEIGFIFHPDQWGQGIASEALSAVIPHIFATLPIHRLTADVDPRNTASIHLLKKHSFTITGHAQATFQLGQEWCDSTYLERRR